MKRLAIHLAGFITGGIRFCWLLILALVLVIVGLIWWDACTYVGLGVLALYLLLCLISSLRMVHFMKQMDSPEFSAMLEQCMAENEHAQLHGEDLLPLSNEELYEAVNDQNLSICEEAEEPDQELQLFNGARRTVYILNTFDMEVQNGGLC